MERHRVQDSTCLSIQAWHPCAPRLIFTWDHSFFLFIPLSVVSSITCWWKDSPCCTLTLWSIMKHLYTWWFRKITPWPNDITPAVKSKKNRLPTCIAGVASFGKAQHYYIQLHTKHWIVSSYVTGLPIDHIRLFIITSEYTPSTYLLKVSLKVSFKSHKMVYLLLLMETGTSPVCWGFGWHQEAVSNNWPMPPRFLLEYSMIFTLQQKSPKTALTM